ncbi:MAG TPA: class I SAM-dependent methyltransferase [Chitinophagaceae bacterium]|nr:class I SAM-dependent methyltransferase [Chitinophagaceae bacterium]
MKQLIKYFLKKLGYELRPLNLNGASNSIEYNHFKRVDAFYSNDQLTQDYIKINVSLHIKNLFTLLDTQKIDLNNKTVIDIGCGTGHALKELGVRYPAAKLQGTEFSEAAIKLATNIAPGIPVYHMDLTLDATSGEFDVVLCQQVLEHIIDADVALGNLWKITARGGVLIITIPDGRLDSFSGHIHFWSKEGFTIFLQKNVPVTMGVNVGHMQDGLSLYAIIYKQ